MRPSIGRLFILTCVAFGTACSSNVPRNNQFDPEGTGPKAPGRIEGGVYIQGYPDPTSYAVRVLDSAGALAESISPNTSGDFISGELSPGTYSLELDVPIENSPVFRSGVEVLPGISTNVGVLSSLQAPPDGVLSGTVSLENSTESAANIRVVASRRVAEQTESSIQYTDSQGQFLFSEMTPGQYEVRADKQSFTTDWKEVSVTSSTRDLVVVPPMKLYPASAVVRFSVPTPDGDVIGAPFSAVRDIDLLLLAFGGVNEMRVSEAEDFMEGGVEVPWRDHLAQIQVQLSEGEGDKAMFAQFRVVDGQGLERLRSDTYEAAVILDQTPPSIIELSLGQSPLVRDGVVYLTDDLTAVPLTVLGVDSYSHVTGVKVIIEDADPATTPFNVIASIGASTRIQQVISLSAADGSKRVQVQLRDGAGNISEALSQTVMVDTTAPVQTADPGIEAAPVVGADLASQDVSLRFFVGADETLGIDGPTEMAYGSMPMPAQVIWGAYTPRVTLQLSDSTGAVVTFWAQFRDVAGNILSLQSAAYTMNLEGTISGRVLLEGVPESDPLHDNTLVEIFAAGADLSGSSVNSIVTQPDGTFTVPGLGSGAYQVRYSHAGSVSIVRSPIQVQNAQTTELGIDRLLLARGELTGYFKFADLDAQSGNHGGITVTALLDNVVQDVAITDATGLVSLQDLPVGATYTIRAAAESYATRTLNGVVVAQDVAGLIAGGADQRLAKLSGDFKICNLLDPLPPANPGDCAPVLYTNEADILLGLSADDTIVSHVRYVLQESANPGELSFTQPAANPSTDTCLGAPTTDCWNPVVANTLYTVPTGTTDGVLTVVVQFFGVDGSKQPVGLSQVIYDTTAPLTPAVQISQGAAAVAPGYTNETQVSVALTAVPTLGPLDEAAPLDSVQVSYDAAWDGEGTNGDRLYTYGGTKLFDLETVSGDGIKDVHAWFCDAAKNCSAAPAFDQILLDRAAPTRAAGIDLTPTGDAIIAHDTLPRTYWSRGVTYGVDVSLGDSGITLPWGTPYAVPEAAAYQISDSPLFVGAQWVTLDLSAYGASDVVQGSGPGLQPADATYTLYVRFQDAAGNVSTGNANDVTLILDRSGPVASVAVNAGVTFAGSLDVTADITVNPVGDATLLQYVVNDLLPDAYPSPDTRLSFLSSLPITLAAPNDGDGEKTFTLRLFDAAGNTSEIADTIIIDTTAPTEALALCDSCSVDPAGVAYYDASLAGQARLFLFANDALSGVRTTEVTVDAGTIAEHVETAPYAPYTPFNISADEGLHSLDVRFIDGAGNASAAIALALEYDSAVPTINSVTLNAGDSWTDDATVTVALDADDSGDSTRLRGMYVSSSATFGDAVMLPYAPSFAWTLDTTTGDGAKELFVRVEDYAGNTISNSATITLDRGAPSLSASLQGVLDDSSTSTGITATASVTLLLTATDVGTTTTADLTMKVVNDPADFAAATWAVFAVSQGHTLGQPAVDGLKVVHVRVKDLAGNIVETQTSIVLDSAPPDTAALSLGGAYTAAEALSAAISVSGATQMCLWGDISGSPTDSCTDASTAWEALAGTAPVTLNTGEGTRTVNLRLRDAARHTIDTAATILLDSTAPTGSVVIEAGALATQGTAVGLVVSASDAQAATTELTMAIANEAIDCAGVSYQGFGAIVPWSIDATDGLRSVLVCLKDPAGNFAEVSATITLDRTAPLAASVSIASGAASMASGSAVALTLSAGGATEMCVAGDLASPVNCANSTPWQAYATSATVDIAPLLDVNAAAFGEARQILVTFRDGAGNTTLASDDIMLDGAGPTDVSFTIAEGDSTSAATINVSAQATGATEMCFDGDLAVAADCTATGSSWQTLASSRSLLLSSGVGSKSITALFRDALGRTTAPLTQTITFDDAAPTAPALSINDGATATASRSVTLTLDATGAIEMAVANGSISCGSVTYEALSPSKAWLLPDADGSQDVAACFRDAAGNSTTLTTSISLDRSAPSVSSVVANSGGGYTTSTTVTLTLASAGADEMCISGDLSAPLACQSYGTSETVTLAAGDGPKSIVVSFRDLAGNSDQATTSIVLDTTSAYAEQISITPSPYALVPGITANLAASGATHMCLWGDFSGSPADSCSIPASTGWETMTTTKALTLTTGDAAKTVNVKYRDAAQQESGTATATVTLDETVPASLSVQIDSNAGYTDSRAVTVTLAATDPGSGISEIAIANGSITCSSATYEAFTGQRAWTLDDTDGTRTVAVCFKDNAGQVSQASDTIELDRSAPTVGSVAIQQSAVDVTSVSTTAVDLVLAAANADEMCITGDITTAADCSDSAAWIAYATSASVALTAGDGFKLVTVRYRDLAGNTLQATDSAVLDTSAPSAPYLALTPSDYATSTTIAATLQATGADEMCLWGDISVAAADCDNTTGTAWESYATTKPTLTLAGADGTKTVNAKFRDNAGSVSATVTATVLLDTADPTGASILISNAASYANSRSVVLTLAASDATSGLTEMAIANGTITCSSASYTSFAESFSWTLADTDGLRTVAACFRDAAGNSATTTSTITLDRVAPTGVALTLDGGSNYNTTGTVGVSVAATDATSSTLEYRLSDSPLFADSAWVSAATSAFPVTPTSLTMSDGVNLHYLWVRDSAGNRSSASDSITVDTSAPELVGATFVEGDVVATSQALLQVRHNGADEMRLTGDLTVPTPNNWIAVADYTSVTLATADASNSITVELRDLAGQVSSPVSATASIYRDETAPQGVSVSVNAGDAYTGSSSVVLDLATTDESTGYGVVEISIVDGGSLDCATASYTAFAAFTAWSLPAGDASKSVTVCFRDAAGNSASATDSIILDTTEPSSVTFVLNSGSTYATSSTVAYTAAASDNLDTTLDYEITTSASPTGSWTTGGVPAAGTLTLSEGAHTYYLHVRDDAALVTTVSSTVTVDTIAPANPLITLSPSIYVTSDSVTAIIGASGATEMCFWGDVDSGSLDSCAANGWVSLSNTAVINLTDADGTKTVRAKFRDAAANTTAETNAQIVLDSAVPVSTSVSIDGGAGYSASGTVTLTLSAGDGSGSGVTEVAVANGASCGTSWQAYVPLLSWALDAATDGSKSVAVCFRDDAGNATTVAATDTIVVDRAAPKSVRLLLDAGATYNTDGSVALSVEADDTNSGTLDYLIKTVSYLDSDTDTWITGVSTTAFPVTPTASPVSPSDGTYAAYLWVRDQAGSVTSGSASIIVDTAAPTLDAVNIREDDGSGITAATSVTLEISSTGADEVRVTGDITGGGSWVAFSNLLTVDLDTAIDGSKSITVEVRDAAGNAPSSVATSITYDSADPAGSFTINVADSYTSDSTVVLDLSSADALEIAITNSSSIACASETRTSFETPITWNVGTGDGTKWVSICFYDAAGNSLSSSKSIILDTTAPDTLTLALTGSAGSATGYSQNPAAVTAVIHGNETASTNVSYQLTRSPTAQSTWTTVLETVLDATISGLSAPTLNSGNGIDQTVYLHVKDEAGNVATTSASIIVDTMDPLMGTPVVLEAVTTPTGTAVDAVAITLELFALDAEDVEVTGDVNPSISWTAFASNISVSLSAGDGSKTVTVRVRDASYNASTSLSVTVSLDTAAPSTASVTLAGLARGVSSAQVTQTTKVNVPVSGWSDGTGTGIKEFQISENSNFAGAPWVAQESILGHLLSAGDGTKTLFIKARDYVGNESTAVQDSIYLDQTAPIASSATPNKAYSSTRNFTLALSADDAYTTTAANLQLFMKATSDAVVEGSWVSWSNPMTVDIDPGVPNGGTANMYLLVRDEAGNVAAFPTIDPVVYDASPPSDPSLAFIKSLNHGVLLSWSASSDNIVGAIANYVIEFHEAADASTCADVPAGQQRFHTVSGTDNFAFVLDDDDGGSLRNKRQHCFRLKAVDLSGQSSGWTSWRDVAVGWMVLPVVSSATAVLVPQGIVYHHGKIFLLYHEQSIRSGFGSRVASTAKLAISEDGGETWRISLIQLQAGDGGYETSGPVPGRVKSELTMGNRGISVITPDWSPIGTGDELALVDFYSEDEGLTWKRAIIDPTIGDGKFTEYPLAVAGTGSSRTIGYTRTDGAAATALLKMQFKRSADDVRDQAGADQAWWQDMGIVGTSFDDPGRHIVGCNANYTDRFLTTIPNIAPNPPTAWSQGAGANPFLVEGKMWSMVSPFHGNRWDPPPTAPFGPFGELHDPLGGGTWDFQFTDLACVGLGKVAWSYIFATVSDGTSGEIRLKVRTQVFDNFSDRPSIVSETSDEFGMVDWQPWATSVDSATPMAAWAGLNKIYAVYRDTNGNAVVKIGTNTPKGELQPDTGIPCPGTDPSEPNPKHINKACITWVTNYVDQTGDAAYNPVFTGYNNASPLMAYTDNFGTQIKIARAALMAPQTVASTSANSIDISWGATAGTRNYDVLDFPATGATCSTTPTVFGTTDTQVQGDDARHCYRIAAVDENDQQSDAGRAWEILAFTEKTVISEASGPSLFEDYYAGNDCDILPDEDACTAPELAVVCYWNGTNCLQIATTPEDCFAHITQTTCNGEGGANAVCTWNLVTQLCQSNVAQTEAATITSSGSAVAAAGNIVAVIPPTDKTVTLRYSDDNGNTWNDWQVAISTSPMAFKNVAITYEDADANGVPEFTYIHVVHQENPEVSNGYKYRLLYNRIVYNHASPPAAPWPVDVSSVELDGNGGEHPDIVARDDIIAISWVENVATGAPASARVQLRGDHGQTNFAESRLDGLSCESVAVQAECGGTARPECFWGSCDSINDCGQYVDGGVCDSKPGCAWNPGPGKCEFTTTCDDFITEPTCSPTPNCAWVDRCVAGSNPQGCGDYMDPNSCDNAQDCFWDPNASPSPICKPHSGSSEITGEITSLSIADLDVHNLAYTRVFAYYAQKVGGVASDNADTAVLSSEFTFNIDPDWCDGKTMGDCGTEPDCFWDGANCQKNAYPVTGVGAVYRMCLPGDCKKTKLIAAARNSQFFTVFSAGDGGEGFGDPRVQISMASERVAGVQEIADASSTFHVNDAGGLWTRANLSANEQVVLYNSLAAVSDPDIYDGIWTVYSTCSNLGLNTVWKLNMAYCQSGCQAMENWNVSILKTQPGVAGYECTGEWFGALTIALDSLDRELYIGYFADTDGTKGTGIANSDSYELLTSGFLGIVEDRAAIVGE